VVFASDHGEMDASHRLEHKSVLYEESVHVPLFVCRKGVTKPGLVDREHLVSNAIDIIPTMCDFACIPTPSAFYGRSLRPLAQGEASESWRDYLISETLCARMVRTVRYKYVVCDSGARREQLMDLEKDPGEMQNLAADPAYGSVLAECRQRLVRWYAENHETLDSKYLMK
jgi:arylsulfatase A-like enzyme